MLNIAPNYTPLTVLLSIPIPASISRTFTIGILNLLYSRLTATHSFLSTYFGKVTIVLKLPLIKADLTKGLQRYRGLVEDVLEPGGAAVCHGGDCPSKLGIEG